LCYKHAACGPSILLDPTLTTLFHCERSATNMPRKIEHDDYDSRHVYSSARPAGYDDEDVFGNEEAHDIRYKTLSWPMVAVLMIAEIVSNGMMFRCR